MILKIRDATSISKKKSAEVIRLLVSVDVFDHPWLCFNSPLYQKQQNEVS